MSSKSEDPNQPTTWYAVASEKYPGRAYYFNPKTNESTWILPDNDHPNPNACVYKTLDEVGERDMQYRNGTESVNDIGQDSVPRWRERSKRWMGSNSSCALLLGFLALVTLVFDKLSTREFVEKVSESPVLQEEVWETATTEATDFNENWASDGSASNDQKYATELTSETTTDEPKIDASQSERLEETPGDAETQIVSGNELSKDRIDGVESPLIEADTSLTHESAGLQEEDKVIHTQSHRFVDFHDESFIALDSLVLNWEAIRKAAEIPYPPEDADPKLPLQPSMTSDEMLRRLEVQINELGIAVERGGDGIALKDTEASFQEKHNCRFPWSRLLSKECRKETVVKAEL